MMDTQKDPVTIESLLRLKRLERPPAEFWTEFETQLRAKQLAAMLEKRPWWKDAVQTLVSLRRYHVPVAGAAALALAFVTVRDFRSGPPASSEAYIPAFQALHGSVSTAGVKVSATSIAAVPAETRETAVVQTAPVNASVAESAAATVPTTLIPILVGATASDTSLSPSARAIESNLAEARAAQPDVARRLFSAPVSAFEARALPAMHESVGDPIARIDPASQERRERLLGGMVYSAVASTALAPASNRLASRLSDDRLYEQISRYAGDGSKLSIKF